MKVSPVICCDYKKKTACSQTSLSNWLANERVSTGFTRITTTGEYEQMSSGDKTSDKAAIQEWLTTQIADSADIDRADVDVREPFASYGLSSIAAVSLTADLEDWLQIRLDPTLAWDYPTIDSLARYLADEIGRESEAEQPLEQTSQREFS